MTADTQEGPVPNPDRPIFAIGDLHGRADLMERAFERIMTEIEALGHKSVSIVALGDYVDRGEDSRGVIEGLMTMQARLPEIVTCLMGNHEKLLLDFIDRPADRGRRFLRFGGLQTLASFGVGGVSERSEGEALEGAAERLRAAMGPEMEQWLRELRLWWQSGDVVCVHAGMDPAISPEQQEKRAMLWGHPFFNDHARPDGLWVAHGHEVYEEPTVINRRIACDTGAYATNRLTVAAILPGEAVRFIEA